MRVEIVNTPSGRERVEIDLGGDVVHSLSKDEAIRLADWIIELCRNKVVGGGPASPDTQYVIPHPCAIARKQDNQEAPANDGGMPTLFGFPVIYTDDFAEVLKIKLGDWSVYAGPLCPVHHRPINSIGNCYECGCPLA